ncbi:unnamed protein product, partial [Effrenium voratum]
RRRGCFPATSGEEDPKAQRPQQLLRPAGGGGAQAGGGHHELHRLADGAQQHGVTQASWAEHPVEGAAGRAWRRDGVVKNHLD